ncbi:MAG: hypothetical protein OEZ65_07855 [Gemmatimonadota bacterium]|nr:hypothetical protein [Gemmatimonadota bacterium]MDH5759490.1 hypothetical protein [Gemmatimonadota bacterium]
MALNGRAVREGVTVGLIGYAAVAAFYTLFDLLAGRGLVFTLNLLGKVVFRGVRDPAILQLPIPADVGAMVAYNFVHLVAALAVGLFVAWMVARVEDRPERGMVVSLVMLGGYVITVWAASRLTVDVAPLLPVWTIVTVNTLAAVGGAVFLWRAHPGLWGRVRGVHP